MGQWQPIETAPRDGTVVLVCGGNLRDEGGDVLYSMGRAYTAKWLSYDESWFLTHTGDMDIYVVAPTHWMPLPEPPQAD